MPWAPDIQVVYEHFHRYMWAAKLTEGRKTLDLGSGEGFGAAILAGSAERVVGLDIDERTVEHSQLNYAGPNLEFRAGTALDLAAFDDGSFDVVVAFEVIEHVREQERVLGEVARVLADDGLFIVSTPDRRLYSETSGQHNPFHERELAFDELQSLVATRFPNTASWGQRTITGSHLSAISEAGDARPTGTENFYIERLGEEWKTAGDPAALYVIMLASRAPLPEVGRTSTLADCNLELMRSSERDAVLAAAERDKLTTVIEHERALHGHELYERDALTRQTHQELAQRDLDISRAQDDIDRLRVEVVARDAEVASRDAEIARRDEDLEAARLLNRRTEESVTWQTFQRLRGKLYSVIGERSLLARALRMSLRLAGRRLQKHTPGQKVPTKSESASAATQEATAPTIVMPEHENPMVSLVIPLYSRADLTRACLESIRYNTTHVSYEVILVNDAADEKTEQLLEEVCGAKVVRNESNLGYLRSMNRGAAVARGEWLVLFNNDTEVTRGWLAAMLDCARASDDVGVVTPKFVYPDGTLNEAGGIIWRDGTGVNYGRGDAPDRFQYEYRRETDYGSAAALMVRADLWTDVGGFDERYMPMYYEDTDLCFEARERGLKVMYEPQAVVVHVEGATAGNDLESGHKRYQEQNRPKFVAKWRARLESEQLWPAPTNVRNAANRHRGSHVLIVDHRVPTWDRDAGSLRMLHIIQALLELGARVTFMPDNFVPLEPYTRNLQRMGVEVMYGALDVHAELATIGPRLSAAILSRPHQASRWLDAVREHAPGAPVVYDTVDLHWLREARRAGLDASTAALTTRDGSLGLLTPKADALRQLELAMIRATDITFVVTECERVQVEEDVPGAEVLVMPNVHDVQVHVAPLEDRTGILFVGGFEHHPNADAAIRLVKEVMPTVWRQLGDVRVAIVGSNPPSDVQGLASSLVDVTGWVEDLQPLLDRSRLMVAPLRFGAGMKGKITQALAAGLPVITTPVGAEGLEGDDEFMLIAEDSQQLASHVVRAYGDDDLWRSLSNAGQALISKRCSRQVVSGQLSTLLEGLPSRVNA